MGLGHVLWRPPPRCNLELNGAKFSRYFKSDTSGSLTTHLLGEVVSILTNPGSSLHKFPLCSAVISQAPPLTICVGGVTMGGAGKTPVVHCLAKTFSATGHRVSILGHGYQGHQELSHPVEVINPLKCGDLRFGDEASMLRRLLPDSCRLWVGGTWFERWKIARSQGAKVIICDGGLYTSDLPRSLGFVVIPTDLKTHLIPLGELTRPVHLWPQSPGYAYWWVNHALKRSYSDASISMRTSPHSIKYHRPPHLTLNVPQLLSGLQAVTWVNAQGVYQPVEVFRNQQAGMICAIARPKRFCQTLQTLEISIQQRVILRDHRAIPHRFYRRLGQQKLWLTTLKDLVKFKITPEHLWALQTQISLPSALGRSLDYTDTSQREHHS